MKNTTLMKSLTSLCVISILLILHTSRSEESKKRVKKDINSSVELVEWFKSVIKGHVEINPKETNLDKIFFNEFDECKRTQLVNLTLSNSGQVEGDGKIFFDEKCKITSINGKFKNGMLHGKIRIDYQDGTFSRANFDQGALHGLFVHFWCKFGSCTQFDLEAWRKAKHLHEICVYNQGHKIGPSYKFKVGGGFMVDDAYVYPDLQTMIVGHFEDETLMSGFEGQMTGLETAENGLVVPIGEKTGTQPMKFSLSNQTFMGDDPLLRDPMEKKYVYIGKSKIKEAGRGVFLKVPARKGFTVSFYNGVRMSDLESKIKTEDRKSPYRMDNDWAREKEILNIPSQFRSLDTYNATLGHLVNHAKKPNCWFGMIDHPRFGPIRSIVLMEDLEANQELFADYGYLEQYAMSESAIKSIYHMMKWYMNEGDEDFHQNLKHHIHYLRQKVDQAKPYLDIVKNFI